MSSILVDYAVKGVLLLTRDTFRYQTDFPSVDLIYPEVAE